MLRYTDILITFYLLFCTAYMGFGQTNLVVNPSFEDTVNCPTADNQLYNCVGWTAYGSVEYFNSCSSSPDVSVPNNWGGYPTTFIWEWIYWNFHSG